ncbi:hypothetical protein GH975_01385 [Litorivicinus lipolyticus]|uniref:Uncharacterized protein n=1 Tax=Litorivicinus lipolyticus TaxID=418701 RepID=A0A5Q2QBD0_9GAMM|nr:hypothetical protein [Litorivicinus lipolyticus]QGG79287.1 hypothetical protein GH975_01385 [Litorivicinus lipolyticus]
MKTALERWVFDECEALYSRGITPSSRYLSGRVHALGSEAEIQALIADWDQHRGAAHQAELRQSGFSEALIKTFSRPAA